MMPLLKGNSQASGAITFHIPAIRKLTFSPSLLTFSPFSFSVIHSFFLMTGEDGYDLWFTLPKATLCLLPTPSQVQQRLCSLHSSHSHSITQISFHLILSNTWNEQLTLHLFQIPRYLIGSDLGINLTPIFCCPEESKALEMLKALDASCFKEILDPADLNMRWRHTGGIWKNETRH